MPWVDVDDAYSTPPRSAGPMTAPTPTTGTVDVDDRWGSILEAELTGTLDVSQCERLDIRESVLRGVTLIAAPGLEIDVSSTAFVECDLAAVRFTTMTNTRFAGCKLSGIDFGSGIVRDVEIDRSVVRMSTLRMASLERVVVRASTLDDLDCYETTLEDVAFPESDLRAVDLDRATFRRVDFREAGELDLRSCSRFEGCVISTAQVIPLAHLFAHAAGMSIAQGPLGE